MSTDPGRGCPHRVPRLDGERGAEGRSDGNFCGGQIGIVPTETKRLCRLVLRNHQRIRTKRGSYPLQTFQRYGQVSSVLSARNRLSRSSIDISWETERHLLSKNRFEFLTDRSQPMRFIWLTPEVNTEMEQPMSLVRSILEHRQTKSESATLEWLKEPSRSVPRSSPD